MERFAAAQGAEFDGNDLSFRGGHAVPEQAVGNFRRHGAVRLRDFDHRPGFEVRGFQSVVERAELGLRNPETARQRVERFARMDDVIGRTLVGHAVQRLAVLLPLLLRAGFVLRTDLLLADQDAFPEAHVQRIEVGVVLQKGFHGNFILP